MIGVQVQDDFFETSVALGDRMDCNVLVCDVGIWVSQLQ